MAFVTKEWKDRLVEFAGRRKLKNVTTGAETVFDVSRSEGAVSQAGDAFSAANMNNLEQRIKKEFDTVNGSLNNANTSINNIKNSYKFSTKETLTNEIWINGKAIYRKTVVSNVEILSGKTNIPHNIVGASNMWIDVSNSYLKASDNSYYPLSTSDYKGNNGDFFCAYLSSSNIIVNAYSGWGTSWTKVISIKYTK